MESDNYIQSMAENCFEVYQEMTGRRATGLNIEKLDPPFSSLSYKMAVIIPYKNQKDNFEGRFVLGFNNESMAVRLAGLIAEHTGMPAVDQLDGLTTDILFEFMNTVAGKVITEWDKIGLTADFFPPEFVADLSFDDKQDDDILIHSVTLSLSDKEKITILTSLEEKERSLLHGKKILVVDDSKMIRFLLTNELEKRGCQVIQAENGLDGFVKVQANQPDLVIMDLIMPKMGGLEAIEKIRQINASVPIIILTSTSKKEEVLTAAIHKVKGFIKKPLKMDHLLKLVNGCFQKD